MLGRYVKIAPVTYDRLLLSDARGLKNMVSATDTITYIAVQARANHNCLPLFSYPACKLVWHSVGKGYELFRKGNRECGKCGRVRQPRPSFWRDQSLITRVKWNDCDGALEKFCENLNKANPVNLSGVVTLNISSQSKAIMKNYYGNGRRVTWPSFTIG